jgi:toxin secretion/phage lysis holin
MLETIKELLLAQQTILIIVFVAVILDFVTGITKAIYMKNIQSKKLRKTIPKIIGYCAVILIAVCLQIVFNIDFITKIICLFIIVIEFISVIENINNYVTIPQFLIKLLEDKKKELDEGGKDNE